MSASSSIEWTDATVNFWWGCTKVSPGCAHCYADTLAHRFGKDIWGEGRQREDHRATARKLARKLNAKAARGMEAWETHLALCAAAGVPDPRHEWRRQCDALGSDESIPSRPRVFCSSMSDWLDDEVPIEWLADLLQTVFECPHLDWQLLTKRPENWIDRICAVFEFTGQDTEHLEKWKSAHLLCEGWLGEGQCEKPPANVWLGTTVEDQTRAEERIPALLKIPARVRFLSCEPLLGPVTITPFIGGNTYQCSCGFHETENEMIAHSHGRYSCKACGEMTVRRGAVGWVIAGGESGPGARPMHPAWARSLRDQCQVAGVPFLFKQWGEWLPQAQDDANGRNQCTDAEFLRIGKHASGRRLDGRTWSEFPAPQENENR